MPLDYLCVHEAGHHESLYRFTEVVCDLHMAKNLLPEHYADQVAT